MANGNPEMVVRNARAGDSAAFYELLLMSGPEYETVFGAAAPRIFRSIFEKKRNLYSHENTRIIEAGGDVAGMALGYTREEKKRLELRTLALIAAAADLGAVIENIGPLARLAVSGGGSVREGEYYLSNIAVFPSHRGTAAAGILMEDVFETARAKGCRSVALETNSENGRALAFYEKYGFVPGGEIFADIDGRKTYRRMTLELP